MWTESRQGQTTASHAPGGPASPSVSPGAGFTGDR